MSREPHEELRLWAKNRIIGSPVLLAAFILVGWHPHADAATYTIFDPRGSVATYALGIDGKGSITGWYIDPNGDTFGYIRAPGGTFTTFFVGDYAPTEPTSINKKGAAVGEYWVHHGNISRSLMRLPNGSLKGFNPFHAISSYASGINDSGAIVGSYEYGYEVFYGFLRSPHELVSIAPPGSVNVEANGINDSGVIAGDYQDSQKKWHGFTRASDGTYSSFAVSGAVLTYAEGINKAGGVVGAWKSANGVVHGYVRAKDGTIAKFDFPAATWTFPGSINRKGDVTGDYTLSDGVDQGFLRTSDGTITTVNPPNSISTVACSINDHGVIVGYFEDGSSTLHGFVRTP